MQSSFLRIGEQYPSSGLRPSEGIAHQFFGMMTAFTNTSSPELPYSLNTHTLQITKWEYWILLATLPSTKIKSIFQQWSLLAVLHELIDRFIALQ